MFFKAINILPRKDTSLANEFQINHSNLSWYLLPLDKFVGFIISNMLSGKSRW